MYKRKLIGKTLQEAIDCITKLQKSYTVTKYIYTSNYDTELVVRVDYDGVYNLVTSGFRLKVEEL